MGHSSCQAAKFPKLGSPKPSLPLQNPKIRGSFLPRSSKGWERLWGARLAPRMKSGSFQSKLAKPAVDPQMGSPKQALAPQMGFGLETRLQPQKRTLAPKNMVQPKIGATNAQTRRMRGARGHCPQCRGLRSRLTASDAMSCLRPCPTPWSLLSGLKNSEMREKAPTSNMGAPLGPNATPDPAPSSSSPRQMLPAGGENKNNNKKKKN